MKRRKETLTLSITNEEKIILENLAVKNDCLWGTSPSISILLRKISNDELIIQNAEKTICMPKENKIVFEEKDIEILKEMIEISLKSNDYERIKKLASLLERITSLINI